MDFFEKNRVKTFDDLVFKPHPNYFNVGAIHAVMEFPNGHAISVVGGGTGLYGDGETTFEVWTSWQEDVQGYCTKDEVTELMLLTQYKSEKNQIVGFIV